MRSGKGIAFFDLDHTIIDGSTGVFVLYELWNKELISLQEVKRLIYYTILNKCGKLPYEVTIGWIYQTCSKVKVDELIAITNLAYEKYIKNRIFFEALETIKDYKDREWITCIATGSSEYIAEKVKLQVLADYCIGSKSTIENGHLSKGGVSSICYGQGKKDAAIKFANELGVDIHKCVFYSDSKMDLPLLSSVGLPYIVNPSPLSKWYLKLQNFKVVRWKSKYT